MKKTLLILTFLALTAGARAQETETIVVALNDSISVRLRETTREEYDARKAAAAHLQPEPYEVITDIDEVKRLLGDKIVVYEPAESDFWMIEKLTFENGTTRELDADYTFEAYLPKFKMMNFSVGHSVSKYLDMSDGEWVDGQLEQGGMSPDKTWFIFGYYPGQGDGTEYRLHKRNQAKGKHQYVGSLFNGHQIMGYKEWLWVGDNIVLIKDTEYQGDKEEYLEMTIIEK